MFIILAVISLCMPLASFVINIIYYINYKRPFRSAILLGLSYGSVFLNYIPDSRSDIVRHMTFLSNYSSLHIWECFDAGQYTQLYAWDLWNWIISQFNNPNLLPASGAFVGYTIITYIVFDYCRIINLSNKNTITVILLILLATNPIGYAIGIRSSCAYLICVLGIYLSIFHDWNVIKVILLMIIAVELHHSAGLILLIWLFIPLFKKRPILTAIILGLLIISINIIIDYVIPMLPIGSELAYMVLDAERTINIYQNESSYNVMMSTSLKARVELLCSILFIASMLMRIQNDNSINKQNNFLVILEKKTIGMRNISLLYIMVAIEMTFFLVLNGNRYFSIPELLLIPPLIFSFNKRSLMTGTRGNNIGFIIDFSLIAFGCMHLLLNLYSLAWGDASFSSLLAGSIGGIIYFLI